VGKRHINKFAALMEQFAALNGQDAVENLEAVKLQELYSTEGLMLEAHAVYNFFEARVQPFIEKDEKPSDFDRRYREWRFKRCKGCGEVFAYAWDYDSISFCSLDCLEADLEKVGIVFSRHKDLKRRWGKKYPAIVPSSALQTLQELHPNLEVIPQEFVSDQPNVASDADDQLVTPHPRNQS